ncbi:MAG: clan AA aspartic protease [Gammaproteobacteria bacterium]|nr:clan AA aspartic protease [Gammaproteobacteria bacterium]
MGIIQVTATVRNPAAPDRTWDGLFLVDTGSTDCVVPANALRSVGLRPQGSRTYELADGRHSTVDIAVAQIEFMGEFVGATVGFGPEDTEPILGLTALESVGIEIDPVSQTLKRRHAVRMKTAASAALAGLPRSKARKRPEEMQLTASTNHGQAS